MYLQAESRRLVGLLLLFAAVAVAAVVGFHPDLLLLSPMLILLPLLGGAYPGLDQVLAVARRLRRTVWQAPGPLSRLEGMARRSAFRKFFARSRFTRGPPLPCCR